MLDVLCQQGCFFPRLWATDKNLVRSILLSNITLFSLTSRESMQTWQHEARDPYAYCNNSHWAIPDVLSSV